MAPPKFTVDSGLKKPARKAPPKKPPGAFPTTKGPFKPLHGPFATAVADEAAAAEADARQREIKAQLAGIKKVATQRTKATTAKIAGNRVSSQHGLPPVGQPFAGVGQDTGAGARDPYQPDLTAKTQVAKGNRERLQHGGLLTPEQQAREKVNAKTVGSSTAFTFHDTHNLREQPALRDLPETLPVPKGFKAQPLETTEQKDKSWLPHSLSGPLSPRLGQLAGEYLPQGIDAATGAVRAVGGPAFEHLPGPVRDVVAKPFTDPVGAGVDYARGLADPFHVEDAARIVAKQAGHPLPDNPLSLGNRTERAGQVGTELAGKLADVGLNYDPSVPVPNADFLGVSAANAAGTTTIDNIPVAAGLTPAATKKWYNKALALGWNKADLDGIVGVELIKRGIAPPPPWYERLPVQFAAGLARTAAAPVAGQALATDFLTGHAGRALTQLGEGIVAPLPVIGKHPWGQMFMNDPYTVGSAVLPVARGLGAAGLLRRGVSPERLVKLRDRPGETISRGPHSKNLVDQIGEDIHDLAASKSKIISRRVGRKETDLAHQRAVNSEAPQFTDRDHAYALAFSKVGKKRAAVLMAYADSGHLPEAKVRQFEGEAVDAPGGAGAGQHKFWQRVVAETKHLDENDQAFLKALDESARHTSVHMGVEQGFGDDAQEFRRHESPIVAQSVAGDDLAAEILQMRHELHGNGKGEPPDMSGVRQRLAALQAERRNSTRRRNAAQRVVDKPLPEEPAVLAKQREDVAAYEVERAKWSDEHKAILAEEPAPTKLRKNASAKTRADAEVKDKAAMREWRAKRTAHNKLKPKRPAGKQVERKAHTGEKNKVRGRARTASTRRGVHSSNEGRQLKKIQRLEARLEYHTHRTQAARASLEEDYHDALTQFAKEHKERGGQTPTRVKRVLAPATTKRRFQAVSKTNFGHAKRRAKPSRSVLAHTGAHLYDPTSPLIESAAAQRLVTGTAAGRNLLSKGTPAKGYDVVPQGHVFVSDKSATTLGRVVNDYKDNPVDAEDFFKREDGMRHALVRAWTNEPMLREGETVAPGEKGIFLPKAQVDRAIEYMQPISRDKWDQFNSFYSRQLISLYPSTMLGNTVGTQPMAWMAGAGPLSARRALRSMRDKTLVPHTAHRAGAVGSMRTMAAGRNPIKRYQAAMRKGTAWGEDFAKHMVYWKAVTRDMKKAHKALNESETDGLQTTFDDYARMVARGEENVALQDKGLAAANKAMGEGLTPDGMLGRFVGKHVLFHRWVGHIAKLMLVTMPFERPGTLLLMNTMAQYGDQYRKDHGVFPPWMMAFAGLADTVMGGHNFTLAVNMGQLAPQNSIGSPLTALTQSGPWLDRLAGLLAPRDKIAIDMLWQQGQNSMGNGSHIDMGRMAINEGIYTLPGAAKFAPRSGHRPDSIPYFAPRTWDYTDGTRKTPYHDNIVAWADRTGVRPLGSDAPVASWENFYGILSRILGAPLSYTPREGDLNDQINAKTEAKAKKDAGIKAYAKP